MNPATEITLSVLFGFLVLIAAFWMRFDAMPWEMLS
jgi:hypothetical protein